MEIGSLIQTVTLVSAFLSVVLILLQRRGASLGAGFGVSGELYTSRRGLEKSLFVTTVIMTLIFISSIIALLIIPA